MEEMKKIFLLSIAGIALSACAKCYDGKFSETTMTNLVGNDVQLTICREDSTSSQQTVSLLSNQVKVIQWGDPEKINNSTKLDSCPKDHDDEHVKIKVQLTTSSQTLARLCLNSSNDYELVPANQFCPNGTTEIDRS